MAKYNKIPNKRCPFCGGDGEMTVRQNKQKMFTINVVCRQCGASTQPYRTALDPTESDYTTDECISAWRDWDMRFDERTNR